MANKEIDLSMLFPRDTVWTGCDGGLLRNSDY